MEKRNKMWGLPGVLFSFAIISLRKRERWVLCFWLLVFCVSSSGWNGLVCSVWSVVTVCKTYVPNYMRIIDPFPIIGFYLYHVISADQYTNWTTSGIWSCNFACVSLIFITVKTPHKRKMAIICTTITYDDSKRLILFQIYLIYAEQSLADFYSSGTRTGIYFHNYFRCCWRRPWWDDVLPCGSTLFINFPNKNVKNIKEIDMSLCELFRERMSLYRHICELFQRENERIV